jgi:ankyrin repeat protein
MKALIQHGSNIFHRDIEGEGVLHYVCQEGDKDGGAFLEAVIQHMIDQIDVDDVLLTQEPNDYQYLRKSFV